MTSPQQTRRYTRSASVRSSLRLPQPAQSCDVCAGLTAIERLSAHAAFQAINCRKLAPRGVVEARGEASVLDFLDYACDAQIFERDDIEFVDDTMGALVGKVPALPPRPLMCPCDHPVALLAVLPCAPLLRIVAHCLPHTRLIEFRMSLLDALGHVCSYGLMGSRAS